MVNVVIGIAIGTACMGAPDTGLTPVGGTVLTLVTGLATPGVSGTGTRGPSGPVHWSGVPLLEMMVA